MICLWIRAGGAERRAGDSMTILVVAIVALGLLVVVAAVISGFLWFSERKAVERKPGDLNPSRHP